MRIIKIPKSKTKYRTIYVPSYEQKKNLKKVKHQLDWLYLNIGVPDCVHGFWYFRSPVTNALEHINYRFTFSCDLLNFFDSIRAKHLSMVPTEILSDVLVNSAPRQGLPTSPLVSNFALHGFDLYFTDFSNDRKVKYTRYADDITLSSDNKFEISEVFKAMREWLRMRDLYFNEQKNKWQDSNNGRRIICGVSVDRDIKPTYKLLKKLRAAKHQNNKNSIRGLEEWSKMKHFENPVDIQPVIDNKGSRKFLGKYQDIRSLTNTYKGCVYGILRKKLPKRAMELLTF